MTASVVNNVCELSYPLGGLHMNAAIDR